MITIYSQTNCPNCVYAAQRLKEFGIPYTEVKIDKDLEAREFIIGRGYRTVPQLFLGPDIFVEGGWLGLKEMSEADVKKLLYGDNIA